MENLNTLSANEHIVVAHQPNFLPWLGFFYKMTYCRSFILLDDVQYTKGGFSNRVSIKQNDKSQWLTVPVSLPKSKTPISSVTIHPEKFAKKHLATIRQSYGKCPFFDEVFPLLEKHYMNAGNSLVDFNLSLLFELTAYLDISCNFVKQSDLKISDYKNELLAKCAAAVGGTMYVSGRGGQKYITGEEHLYFDAGVKLVYQHLEHPVYSQRGKTFVPGCSIIDLLFNCGKNAGEVLRAGTKTSFEILEPTHSSQTNSRG